MDRPDLAKDPRFAFTSEELEKKGIEDFQLHYALNTLKRLAPRPVRVAASNRTKSR